VSTDDDGEVVGQGDAPPGGDEGLGLERFVAVPGVQQWRAEFSGLTLALSTIVVASLLTAALARLGLHCPEGIV
jgi:hypothetical protein